MKKRLIFLALLLSVIAYAGNNKKVTKQKQQEPIKQQQKADTTAKGDSNSYWEMDPRLGRSRQVEPSKPQKQ